MPKAPRPAQILIILGAVLLIVYGVGIIRVNDSSSSKRYAVPGQLIVVNLHSAWNSLQSSDEAVARPISVSVRPNTTGYFIALRPGTATLRAFYVRCIECLSLVASWAVEIEVRPG